MLLVDGISIFMDRRTTTDGVEWLAQESRRLLTDVAGNGTRRVLLLLLLLLLLLSGR